MSQSPQYESLKLADLIAAARLAVFAQILRGLQALGPDAPTRHAIDITFDPRAPEVVYPANLPGASAASVSVVLQHRYAELQVDWDRISVMLWSHGQPQRVEIPFHAILHIADTPAGFQLDVPPARITSDFYHAFCFALATLMVFQFGTEASHAELEGRAMYALLPALLTRICKPTSNEAATAVIVFDTGIIGVSLPPSIAAIKQDLMSFTLTPGDRDVHVRSDKFMVECEGSEGENWMMVPFLSLQKITVPSRSLTLPFFPGPVADPLPIGEAPDREVPGQGLDLMQFGKVTSPSRFPPGSFAQAIWEAGQFCVSGYVGRHSIPGLRFPQDLRERVPLGPSTSLEILVFDEPRHNAVAFKRGSRYCVGLYHGLLNTIPGFAMALWTRPDVAPWIGDVSRLPPAGERGEIPDGLEGLEADKILFRDEGGKIDPGRMQPAAAARARQMERLVAAMDPVRRKALLQCIEDAFRYIWLHEIGHVVWGHVDLLEASTGTLGMSELDDTSGDELPPELAQFLEYHTDKFAFTSVLNERFNDLQKAFKADKLATPGRGMPAYVDQATIAIVGCLITQLIFAANLKLQGREDVEGSHPPIWFRIGDMISEARSAAESLDLGSDQAAAEEVDKLFKDHMNRAVGSVISTHPVLAQVFQPFAENSEARSMAYAEAFEQSLPKWEAVVRPYFKFHRGENGRAALRD